ncbi:hypothetical protein ARMGADRAFT_1038926 [Armillaria gallica]|uniref:Uncharacterized protein n=1 Tax=Armillaria gallica TaxID=47427 RepID=A0A2H3CL21_ARMGA|nr:hypothetical protein ARMGADRAFT_1038926 [Armillaria gallica]
MLGVYACLLLTRPEPQKGGQINVLFHANGTGSRMHAGFDKSPIPLEFPEAVPTQYKKCVVLFQCFMETCYKLAKYMDINNGIPNDEVDKEEQPQSKKKSKKKQKKVSESEEPAKKKGARKKKKKGTKMVVDETPNATVGQRPPLSEAGNCAEGLPSMENINPALWQESSITPKPCLCPCPLPCPSMTPQQWELYRELLPITGPNNNPNPFAVSPEHPDAILFHSSLPPSYNNVALLQPNEASINSSSSLP